MNPRLMEDDLNDPLDERPYKEGDVWICRNCAAELKHRAVYCSLCYDRLGRKRARQMEPSDD